MTSVEDAIASTAISAPAFAPVAAPRANDTLPRVGFTPRVTPTLERRRLWERRYRLRLRLTDCVVVVLAAILTAVIQTQVLAPDLLLADPWILARIPVVSATTWLVMLAAFHTRDSRIAGSGATEYKRVLHATGLAFGILAIAFVIFQWQGIRTQLVLALPLGLLGLMVDRWSWRQWLTRQRAFGHYISRAVVVGRRDDVEYVISTLQAQRQVGLPRGGRDHRRDDAGRARSRRSELHRRRQPAHCRTDGERTRRRHDHRGEPARRAIPTSSSGSAGSSRARPPSWCSRVG